MQANIAIIVVAFDRPHALSRLLISLQKADYSSYSNIPLIISIDWSGKTDCYTIARDFSWPFGEKKIIQHEENLGLKRHVLSCGDLTMLYDAVIVLEDDLYVSPAFYDYAQQANSYYEDDENIAGIGLYNYRFNEIAYCPFEPLTDGFDNFFLQVPCSWGQIWTRKQWQPFIDYSSKIEATTDHTWLPGEVKLWSVATSWKRSFYNYMLHAKKYFVYPRNSLSTNFSDSGQHHGVGVLVWQTALLLEKKQFRFSNLANSIGVYDAYFELEASVVNKMTNEKLDICIDLNGSKSLNVISNLYLLSSKKCLDPIKKYPLQLYPYENNVLLATSNEDNLDNYISFGLTQDFKDTLNIDRRSIDVNRIFFNGDMLAAAGRSQVYKTLEYKIGKNLLQPIRFFKRLLTKRGSAWINM